MPYLPVNPSEIGSPPDFILLTPEAYVDHPSFGQAIISRLTEAEGFSVAIIPQPLSKGDYIKFGQPKIGFMVSGGVVDSMVNNYTAAKKKRSSDVYSEGGEGGKRPDRALTVYCRNLKKYFPSSPIVIGGIEASLRRFAHYDYWNDKVMPSLLADSGADLLIYGMGERPLWDILSLIKKGIPLHNIKTVEGTAYLSSYENLPENVKADFAGSVYSFCPSFEDVCRDKMSYVKAFNLQFSNANPISGKGLVQKHGKLYVVQNPPARPLTQAEMDFVYALPYMGSFHPMYAKGVPAIEEVKFGITSHRGCFGACSFCALSYHQGRAIAKRSKESIVEEAKRLSVKEDFKGYIHDIGGPTANFRNPSCSAQTEKGVCKDKMCIGYEKCPNLQVDHGEYLDILREVRGIAGIKKVFIRSGIRFDYLMMDKDESFFNELVSHHISGQLKVAPEHCADGVLKLMNKPRFDVYKKFYKKFTEKTSAVGKEQYLVPYLISSHPGCNLSDAKELTEYLKSVGYMPEQVQDFYPTPSTKSTCMYYTGIDPDTLKEIYVPKTAEEKKVQRAMLQYRKSENIDTVNAAYRQIREGNAAKPRGTVRKKKKRY